MKKLAFCPTCNRRRAVLVTLVAVKYFKPLDGDAWFTETGDAEIVCNTCYGQVKLDES